MARSLAARTTPDNVVAIGTTVSNCVGMRYVALILMLIAPSWAGAYTIDQFFKIYDRRTGDAEKDFVYKTALEHYAEGIAKGILFQDVAAEEQSGKNVYCPPKNMGLGKAEIIKLVREKTDSENLLLKKKSNHDWPFAVYAVQALVDKYPCK